MDKTHIKPVLLGAVAGAFLMMIVGFAGLNWHLGGTVKELVSQAEQDSMVAALSPICAARFRAAAKVDTELNATLMEVSSWQRDTHLKDAGYATFAGTEANEAVAEACVKLVTKDLESS